MKNRYWFVGLLVLTVLSVVGFYGCGGGGNGSSEIINGISVPPAPDSTADQASVGGVDSNNNGVRDKVERMLATEFGSDPVFYEKVKAYAIAEQIAMLDPTEENVAAYDDLLRCVRDDKVFDDLGKIDDLTIDTPERRKAYAKAFAGTAITISDEGC